jgi:hypothetical protein
VAVIVGVVMLAIASTALYVVGGSNAQSKEQLAAMQKQLADAKKKAEELAHARLKEKQARISRQKTRAAEADAAKPAPWHDQDFH